MQVSSRVIPLWLITLASKELSRFEADALMAGIMLDTNRFAVKAGVRTFEAAAYLKQNGANTVEVKKLFAVNQEQINGENEIIEKYSFVHSIA